MTSGLAADGALADIPRSLRNIDLPGRDQTIIAVIDSGFDLDHHDLNFVDRSLHFNAVQYLMNQRRKFTVDIGRTRRTYDASRSIRAHGTGVAGIAAGQRHDIREPFIDGVAPGFPIMPLKVSPRPLAIEVAVAIDWAVDHGARVINMSFKVMAEPALVRAIQRAWERGVVMCAAAGNRRPRYLETRVDFPARHPNVIAVGAIDRRGKRKRLDLRRRDDWGSQFGDELDVVAFGEDIRTLDDRGALGARPGDYQLRSWGTSAASPQVAGLAALLFGLKPELTNRQVRDLIEGRCRKLPGYRFGRVPNRKWTWNREVGYGLSSADATLEMAMGGSINGQH